MSYDLHFARLAPGQTWVDLAEADDEYDNDENDDDTDQPVDTDTWQRIVRRVREILPNVEEAGHQLDDDETAIQVSCWADEASVQVPYWFSGAQARHVVATMYRIAAIIEQETGLAGYDPQIEVPTAEAGELLDAAAAVFDNVAASFARRDIRTA